MEDEDTYIAALDTGGTKTIAAILDENGEILVRESSPSIVVRCETHLELCAQAVKRLMHRTELQVEDFTGLGVSPPGIVDNEKGVLLYAFHADWESVETAGYLSKNLGTSRIRCESDINACAIGEKRFGLGDNYTDLIWMTVNTGMDGAVAEGSRLVRGGFGFADELGHSKVEYKSSAHCPCGQYGCLKAHDSGTTLIQETRKRKLASPVFIKVLDEVGLRPDRAGCTALTRAGNMDTLDILNQIGTYLGHGISYCINILNTQAIVVGSRVTTSLDLLLPPIRVSVQQSAFKQMQDIGIVKTPLGCEAALLGAAALVLKQ